MAEDKGSEDSLVYEYTQATTLHGISRVTGKQQSTFKRIAWAIACLACVALFLYFLCHAFIKYFEYPVTTKLTYGHESKLDFPSVTICNYNLITAAYLEEKNDPMLNASVEFASLQYNPFVEPPALREELADYMKTVDAEELFSQGAHQMNIYTDCFYPSGISENCNFTDGLMVTRGTDMGVCHTFHPQSYIEATGKAIEATSPGQTGGLTVMVDVEQHLYTWGSSAAGIKVSVHDPKSEPEVFELGVALQPGIEAHLTLQKNIMISLPEPYAEKGDSCLDTEDPDFVNPLKYETYYSYQACEKENIIAGMLRNCNCVHYFYKVPNVTICNFHDSVMCVDPYLDNLEGSEVSHGCLKQCKEVQYEVTVSQANFPNKRVMSEIKKRYPVTDEYVRENILALNVYFGKLAVQTVKQEKGYTLQSAIAEIGGYLGLCLGASILTLCELLQLFWDYCERCANSERRNKNSVTAIDVEMGLA